MRLTSLISVNCNEQNQARLSIKRQGQEAALYFEGGRIVHAVCDLREGNEVVYDLLTWDEGEFELEAAVPSPKQTVDMDWSGLILEGMRRLDESKAEPDIFAGVTDFVETGTSPAAAAMADRMAKGLKRIAGVDQVVVCSLEGEILAQEGAGDALSTAALTVFTGQQALFLQLMLNADTPGQVALIGEKRKMLIISQEQRYIGLVLSPRVSAESLMPSVRETLLRYRAG